MALPQYSGAYHKVVFSPFLTSNVEWLESDWKHRGANVLHERIGANVEVIFEIEPVGGDLKDETAKPTT